MTKSQLKNIFLFACAFGVPACCYLLYVAIIIGIPVTALSAITEEEIEHCPPISVDPRCDNLETDNLPMIKREFPTFFLKTLEVLGPTGIGIIILLTCLCCCMGGFYGNVRSHMRARDEETALNTRNDNTYDGL